MNTDKTLHNKFIENAKKVGKDDNPIWYYKEIESVNVDYVIWNLLKTTFIVEIDNIKYEITFGKNKNNEIGECIRYSDIEKSWLCSHDVINSGFIKGKWFIITDKDTTEDFKKQYNNRKEEYEIKSLTEMYHKILKSTIMDSKDLSEDVKEKYIKEIDNSSFEKLKELFNSIKWI